MVCFFLRPTGLSCTDGFCFEWENACFGEHLFLSYVIWKMEKKNTASYSRFLLVRRVTGDTHIVFEVQVLQLATRVCMISLRAIALRRERDTQPTSQCLGRGEATLA